MKNVKRLLVLAALVSNVGCNSSGFSVDPNSYAPITFDDPLLKYAWHIQNTGQQVFAADPAVAGYDLNVMPTWLTQTLGSSVVVQISDDGLEDTHPDLVSNFPYLNQSKDYTLSSPFTATRALPQASTDNHGTAVAGLIAAAAGNSIGSCGVAPRAQLLIANFLSDSVTQTEAKLLDQANGSFDILNMSWGTTQNQKWTITSTYNSHLKSMTTNKRNGKGALFVKSAGNDFVVLCRGSTTNYCIGNANFDSDNDIPYIIVAAALNAEGSSASYSSPGSSIWVTTYGGEYGNDSPAMVTTDRTGCSDGYSQSAASNAFEKGTSSENSQCNYTTTFNGTSSAAPVLSGVIALMLEANPQLTWRQVKHILATTASMKTYSTAVIDHPSSGVHATVPAGFIWEQGWITNAAGYRFHNWYGFGSVDATAAVNLAQTYKSSPVDLGTWTESNWAHASGALNVNIPDNDATGATTTLNVATNLRLEAVQIKVSITHADVSELALELTSPSGTKSILVNGRNSLTGVANYAGETLLSNAFYQESSTGTWTLRVIDAKNGTSGTLTSFSLNFFGSSL